MLTSLLLTAALATTVTMEDGRVFEAEVELVEPRVSEPASLFELEIDTRERRPCPHHQAMMAALAHEAMEEEQMQSSLTSMLEGLVEQLLAAPSRLVGAADAHPCGREMAITGCSHPACLKQFPEVLGDACASMLLSRPSVASAPEPNMALAWMLGEPPAFEQRSAADAMRIGFLGRDGDVRAREHDVRVYLGHHHEEHHEEHHEHHGHHGHHHEHHHGHHHSARAQLWEADEQPAELDDVEAASACFSFLLAILFWGLVLRVVFRRCGALGEANNAAAAPTLEPLEAGAVHKPDKVAPAVETGLPAAVAVPVSYKGVPKDPKEINML